MAELNEIYRRARYYDVAFARDIGREVQFIRDLHQRRSGRPLASLLEIACGPGYHARAFARLGVKTWGLDLRPGSRWNGRRAICEASRCRSRSMSSPRSTTAWTACLPTRRSSTISAGS